MCVQKKGISRDPFAYGADVAYPDVCGCVGGRAFDVDVDFVDSGGFDGARVEYDVARCEYDGAADDVDAAGVGQDVTGHSRWHEDYGRVVRGGATVSRVVWCCKVL